MIINIKVKNDLKAGIIALRSRMSWLFLLKGLIRLLRRIKLEGKLLVIY